jgi:hypothetical protein
MIGSVNPLKVVGTIGLLAVSGTIIALGCKVKDWRWISAFSSTGCVLGAAYLDSGTPLLHRLL